jgi:hypothetical protein
LRFQEEDSLILVNLKSQMEDRGGGSDVRGMGALWRVVEEKGEKKEGDSGIKVS